MKKKFNATIIKIHEDYKNLTNSTGDSILHALINKTILLYAELRDKIEKNKELLNGTIYNLTKALIDLNNTNTTPLADQLNGTLDKNRENFIGELIKLLDFGIKIRDKLDNLKSLNGFKPKVTKKIFSNFGLLLFFVIGS